MVCQLCADNQEGKWKVEEERGVMDGSFLVCTAMLYTPDMSSCRRQWVKLHYLFSFLSLHSAFLVGPDQGATDSQSESGQRKELRTTLVSSSHPTTHPARHQNILHNWLHCCLVSGYNSSSDMSFFLFSQPC